MQKYILVLLLWVAWHPIAYAQTNQPSEQEIKRYKEEAEQQQQEYIENFLSTLDDADEFQKHVIKQKIESYFVEQSAIYRAPAADQFQKKEAIEQLKQTHFKDLEGVVSDETMSKILEAVEPNLDKIKAYKKQKRKKTKK